MLVPIGIVMTDLVMIDLAADLALALAAEPAVSPWDVAAAQVLVKQAVAGSPTSMGSLDMTAAPHRLCCAREWRYELSHQSPLTRLIWVFRVTVTDQGWFPLGYPRAKRRFDLVLLAAGAVLADLAVAR